MRHVYHYSACIPSGYGASYEVDGLLNTASPIVSMDQYKAVKQQILDTQGLSRLSAINLTIKSLSLLQTLEE